MLGVPNQPTADLGDAIGGGSVTYTLTAVETLPTASAAAVRMIYEDGFPPHLKADYESLTDNRHPGELALALTGPGGPFGFALLRSLGTTGWMFLRYLVINAPRRGQGLGGVLWDLLTAALREWDCSLLVWDVEDPDEPGCPPEEVRTRRRRIAFYERHGGVLLPVTGYGNPYPVSRYEHPHGDEQDGDWASMRLMAAALDAGRLAGDPPVATAAHLRSVVEAVYLYRWSLSPGHPQVERTSYAAGPYGQAGD
jgi:GNAT superfamily N-acetyltransferase